MAVRLHLTFAKSLWGDEIFTLDLARRPFAAIVEALRLDTGPPLHYFLARLLLLPFPAPGPGDVVVRLFSVLLAVLHIPLFVLLGRRLGSPAAGLRAAALFSLFPLAADHAAEGRSYMLATLLLLVAFERALALRSAPSAWRAATLGVVAAATVLAHYLALLPLAGLAWLLRGATRRGRVALVGAGALAVLLISPWLPIAWNQPRAAMGWVHLQSLSSRVAHFLLNLGAGMDLDGVALAIAAPAAVGLLTVAIVRSHRGPLAPLVGSLAAGLAALALAEAVTGTTITAGRTAVPFLPLVAMLLGGARRWIPLAVGVGAIAVLAVQVPRLGEPIFSEEIVPRVLPGARAGSTICAAGLWGPELDYRLRREGLPGKVVLFPSDVAAHPGWYVEGIIPEERLRAEAAALVRRAGRPDLYVLAYDLAAARALVEEIAPLGPRPVATSSLLEILELPRGVPAAR